MDEETLKLVMGNEKEWRKHLSGQVEKIRKLVEKQNGRVDKLEIKFARMIGFGSAVVVIVPLVLKYLL